MWKMSLENFRALVRGTTQKKIFLKYTFPQTRQKCESLSPQHEPFLKSNRKSITLPNCRDAEIEPGCGK